MKRLFTVVLCSISMIVTAQPDSLSSAPIQLKEITIQSDIPNHFVRKESNSVDVQNSTEQLLSQTMGVQMIRRGNFGWEPTIRGLNAGQINMTIDGMAIFGACTDRMDPVSSYIEPNNLQSILISYSTDAAAANSTIGGGFDFKLRTPVLNATKRWSGMAGLGYESNGNALQTLAAINYSSPKLAINGNGIFRSSGNYRAGGYTTVDFSQYHKWNGGISAKYKLADHHFLTANYIQDEGYDIGYPGLTMDVAYAKAKIMSLAHRYENVHSLLDQWETKIYFNHIDHAMDDTKRPASQVPMHMDMPGTSTTLGFYTKAHLNFNNRQEVTAKITGYQNRLHASMTMYPEGATQMYMLTIPDAARSLIGINVADHFRYNSQLTFQFGIQAELVGSRLYSEEGRRTLGGMTDEALERTRFLYNSYVGASFQINSQWLVTAQAARAMRSPTLKELYSFYIFVPLDGYDYIGNPGLKKEKSWNISLGTTFKKEKVTFSVQGYTYLFTDYITGVQQEGYSPMTHGAEGVKKYRNLNSASLTGIESEITFRPVPKLQIVSKNTFEYGVDNHHRALPRIPPYQSRNEIQYRLSDMDFRLTGIFAARQGHIDQAFYGETETPGYGIFNISAGRTFRFRSCTLSIHLGLENILDDRYYEHLDISNIPRPGRNFITHVTIRF